MTYKPLPPAFAVNLESDLSLATYRLEISYSQPADITIVGKYPAINDLPEQSVSITMRLADLRQALAVYDSFGPSRDALGGPPVEVSIKAGY